MNDLVLMTVALGIVIALRLARFMFLDARQRPARSMRPADSSEVDR